MKPESIEEIDQLLEKLENASEEQLPEKLSNFLNSVCDAVHLPHDALFNPTKDHNRKNSLPSVCYASFVAMWRPFGRTRIFV